MNSYDLTLLLFSIGIGLTILSKRINVPYPIVLIIGGAVLACIPKLPQVRLDPDLIFTIFLPPLLFAGAFRTEWPAFRARIRAISLLAFGLVLFTTVAVAWVAHHFFGMSWATGFVLGAIVSPPDAVAATAITHRLRVPKALITMIEGESLINDATGLTAYRCALVAVSTGDFNHFHAARSFAFVTVTGIVIGLSAGLLAVLAFRLFAKLSKDDPMTLIAVTLLLPYAIYLPCEHIQSSGVLATVTAGIVVGHNATRIFEMKQLMMGNHVWEMVEYLLNVVIFILIGLAMPEVVSGLSGYAPWTLVKFAVILAVAMTLVRIIWVFPAAYVPFLFPSVRKSEKLPPVSGVMILAWTGMRGVVSLAAAIAIPVSLANGTLFPDRKLIIFLTFTAILSTLVIQGLTLPWLIRLLGVDKLEIPVDPRVAAAEMSSH